MEYKDTEKISKNILFVISFLSNVFIPSGESLYDTVFYRLSFSRRLYSYMPQTRGSRSAISKYPETVSIPPMTVSGHLATISSKPVAINSRAVIFFVTKGTFAAATEFAHTTGTVGYYTKKAHNRCPADIQIVSLYDFRQISRA